MTDATKAITEFIEKNGHELAISLKDIAQWIRSGDWAGFARDVRDAAQAVNSVVQQFGGWKNVIEDLVALRLAGWLFGILAPLRALAGLTAPAWLTSLPTIAAAAGVLTQRSSSGPGSAKTWQDTVEEGRAAGKSFEEISKEQDQKDAAALRSYQWRKNLMGTAPGAVTTPRTPWWQIWKPNYEQQTGAAVSPGKINYEADRRSKPAGRQSVMVAGSCRRHAGDESELDAFGQCVRA